MRIAAEDVTLEPNRFQRRRDHLAVGSGNAQRMKRLGHNTDHAPARVEREIGMLEGSVDVGGYEISMLRVAGRQ